MQQSWFVLQPAGVDYVGTHHLLHFAMFGLEFLCSVRSESCLVAQRVALFASHIAAILLVFPGRVACAGVGKASTDWLRLGSRE